MLGQHPTYHVCACVCVCVCVWRSAHMLGQHLLTMCARVCVEVCAHARPAPYLPCVHVRVCVWRSAHMLGQHPTYHVCMCV
ncbi:hypothetical protein LEMLEM_LOCUS24870, partial [Lemmus lemmus]